MDIHNNDVTVELGTPAHVSVLLDPICQLYDDVFSVPPFVWTETESAHHRQMLSRLTTDPGFGVALAKAGDALVGFVYGYTLHSDTNWWQGFQNPVSSDLTNEWSNRTFAIIDLAVNPR